MMIGWFEKWRRKVQCLWMDESGFVRRMFHAKIFGWVKIIIYVQD